jgi:hypothetical protein
MNHRELLLYLSIFPFEIGLCLLAYARNLHRRLPNFTIYATLLLISTLSMGFIYDVFGFQSAASYYANWMTTGVNTAARTFAIAELCRYGLRAYTGIWALAWRLLVFLGVIFLIHAGADAFGQPDRIAIYGLTLERDIGVTSIVVLLAMLLIRNYYRLTLDTLEKWIAVGMLFLCVAYVVNDTMLQDLFSSGLASWFHDRYISLWPAMKPQVVHANDWWNTVRTAAFIGSLTIWCFALRKPIPEPAEAPILLPAEVYQELSPAISLRLRALNDRLLEMLKP